ncbi:hypothetical protein LINPERHAP1_LOCUS7050 [Linum perenne]
MKSYHTVSRVWLDIRSSNKQVHWSHLIWKKPIILKNTFLSWLVTLNRLVARDRLFRWVYSGYFVLAL